MWEHLEKALSEEPRRRDRQAQPTTARADRLGPAFSALEEAPANLRWRKSQTWTMVCLLCPMTAARRPVAWST